MFKEEEFQIDLFDMTKTPDDKYHWFLRYTNCSTKQVCLKPIQTGGIDEIANVLVDIYCEHGTLLLGYPSRI